MVFGLLVNIEVCSCLHHKKSVAGGLPATAVRFPFPYLLLRSTVSDFGKRSATLILRRTGATTRNLPSSCSLFVLFSLFRLQRYTISAIPTNFSAKK
jgi:hypothetical protein